MRLELVVDEGYGTDEVNFNSIKVRLERFIDARRNPTYQVFQFHKGAIRTERAEKQAEITAISIP